VVATGAGSASRQSLGTAVFGGMFIATFLSLFVVPILYIVIKTLSDRFLSSGGQKLRKTEGADDKNAKLPLPSGIK
ncbi:MAG: efflux RND transporter permease subunit, partial [Pseudanabaenales cyanobacterium]|nr:efflux RND transporter permease subunit [Pseudanabaenales cyanobacterium]